MSRHTFDKTILRASDIRGIVGETLFKEDAYYIGRCFATSIIRKTGVDHPEISVAYDGRLSSIEMQEALTQGLIDSGARVFNYGCGPSPMMYFSVHHNNHDAGIMVTGSHNPAAYNGFKMMIGKKSFYGDDLTGFHQLLANDDLIEAQGVVDYVDIFEEYVAELEKGFIAEGAKELKVAWDPGNGAAGDAVAELVKRLPGEHFVINEKIDGTFPAHHPDPTVPKNLVQLIDLVRKNGCDLGVAFDGDGDRVATVDSTGRIVWGDQMMTFFARDVLSEHPGATIIADVKSSQTLFDDVALHDGVPVMWKTGHAFIKSKMAEEKALLAGEMSGHIFFADRFFGFDDGVYAGVRMMNWVAHQEQTLAQAMDKLPKVDNTPEIRMHVDEDRKFAVVDEIKQRLSAAGALVNDIDGVRVNTEFGWWLARASNTEAALIVRCEGLGAEGLAALKAQASEQLKLSGIECDALAA